MTGCTDRQSMYKVLIPSARRDILIGVNQVIMQCLAMVVIASLIGAKGLGNDLLTALNGLRVGKALEIGICIVLIAIVLDRLSLAWANKQTDYFAELSFKERHKYSLMFLVVICCGRYSCDYWFVHFQRRFLTTLTLFHITKALLQSPFGKPELIGFGILFSMT